MPNKFEGKLDILMGVNEPGITLRKVIGIGLGLALMALGIWMMRGPWGFAKEIWGLLIHGEPLFLE